MVKLSEVQKSAKDFQHGLDFLVSCKTTSGTGKSFSETLILASTNPQYDERLFIELQVQYMKTTISKHVVYTNHFYF